MGAMLEYQNKKKKRKKSDMLEKKEKKTLRFSAIITGTS